MIAAALPFVVMAVASIPWVIFATRHLGHRLGVILPVALVLLVSMLVLVVTRLTLWDIQTSLYVTLTAILAAGVVVLVRSGVRPSLPRRVAVATWLPASLGAVVWLGVVGAAQLIPGASHLSWVLNGDGSNNVHEARTYLGFNGIPISSHNPVPVVRGLFLLALTGGRDASASTDVLLRHDLGALVTLWTIGLAVMSVLIGVVASSLVPRSRPVVIAIAGAVGSLFTLTWFVSGLPIEFGYLNTSVAIPLLLCCWIVFLEHQRPAAAVLILFAVLGLLVVATWTALAVVPVALATVVVTRRWLEIRILRGPFGLVIAGILALLVALVFFVTGPSLADKLGVLGTEGHGFPVTLWLLAALLVVCIAGAAALSSRLDPLLIRGTVALAVSAVVGMTILTLASRSLPDPFSGYYGSKFAWFMCVLLIAIGFSIAAAALSLLPRAGGIAVAVVGALTLGALTLGPPPDRAKPSIVQPIDRVLGDRVWSNGEASAELILANLDDPGTTILWNSDNPDEAFINFWVLEYRGGGGGPNRDPLLRSFEFRGYRELRDEGIYTVPRDSLLCDIASRVPEPVTVVTADPKLEDAIAKECPELDVTFAVEE